MLNSRKIPRSDINPGRIILSTPDTGYKIITAESTQSNLLSLGHARPNTKKPAYEPVHFRLAIT
ncbi:MAG: hypothetical protein PVI26_12620 [Chitinispirillia bacterium]